MASSGSASSGAAEASPSSSVSSSDALPTSTLLKHRPNPLATDNSTLSTSAASSDPATTVSTKCGCLGRLLGRGAGDRSPAIRRVWVNDWTKNSQPGKKAPKFCNNYITTSKYNVVTFLPKNLFEQFRRLANFYFLMISALQLIPGLSPTGRWTTLLPLCLVLLATALKEVFEDVKRHRQDSQVNNRPTWVYRGDRFERARWEKVRVGDVVRLNNRDLIPADIVLLASTDARQGIAYVETSQLDGETNLKLKQSLEETKCVAREGNDAQGHLEFAPELLAGARIDCEAPNNRIHTFEGTLLWNGTTYRLDPKQLLLRGCCLRNTREAVGVVIFTGKDTKLMMNQRTAPLKRSNVEVMVNKTIIFLFATEILLALVCAVGSAVWLSKNVDRMWYLQKKRSGIVGQTLLNFLTFVILFNNLIPISLYVSVEFVRLLQAYFINSDETMVHKGTYALARTSNLNDELGQVHYVFSDKTGTLTQNIMQFRKCSVAGQVFGRGESDIIRQARKNRGLAQDAAAAAPGSPASAPGDIRLSDIHQGGSNNGQARGVINEEHVNFEDERFFDIVSGRVQEDQQVVSAVHELLSLMAVCHTVVSEAAPPGSAPAGTMLYQYSSPDEGALVCAAKAFGFEFVERTPKSVTVKILGEEVRYELLNILEFNGTRKRMSVIVRNPEGKLVLYCKGADTVIYQRLAPQQPYADDTIRHLQQFASEGLRTLCLSFVVLDAKEYEEWNAVYQAAANSIGNRDEELDKAADLIEKNLFLLGATAIEDKLQDGVPETIHDLAEANVKIWMLTGDKQETAVNIGFACQLLTPAMKLICLNEETARGTTEVLDAKLTEIADRGATGVMRESDSSASGLAENETSGEIALIIDSKTLDYALVGEAKAKFVELSKQCKAVVCCRCTPLQKASIVKLIRESLDSITLAIGDGANDVSMIQSAHVGIGISGEEGLQAARSSDYAIAQFRFLKRLLLVHGRFSYRRTSTLILYTFYRNFALYMTQFWYSFINGFSGQSLFDRWTLAVYNVLFTFLPVVVYGMFDKDVSEEIVYMLPQLFSLGQKKEVYNYRTFWGWTINGLYQSFLCTVVPYAIQSHTMLWQNGWTNDLYSFGHTVYTCVVITVSFKLFIETRFWTWVTHLVYWGSLILYLLWIVVYGVFWYLHVNLGDSFFFLGYIAAMSPSFWFTILIVPIFGLARDVCWKFSNRTFWPKPIHIAQELEFRAKKESYDFSRLSMDQFTTPRCFVSDSKPPSSRAGTSH